MENIEKEILDGISNLKTQVAGAVTKDALDTAIAKAASKTDLDAIAEKQKLTHDLAEKLNERLGQIQTNTQEKKTFDQQVMSSVMEKIGDIKEAVSRKGGSYLIDTKAAGTMDFANNKPNF